MTDVQTREGIFGGGGYGGGLFDGSNMGFGGLGGLGAFPAPSKYPNGYPTSTYTAKSGETGTSIARDITGSPNKWTALLAANPETKSAQYGMAFNPGKTLKLPAAWVASVSAPPVTHTDSPSPITQSSSSETEPAASPTSPAAPAAASFSSSSGGGLSRGMLFGLVGVAVVAGIFIMRKK